MNLEEARSFIWSIDYGMRQLNAQAGKDPKSERSVPDFEQFFSGMVDTFGYYNKHRKNREGAQKLLNEYGGAFERGVRVGILLGEKVYTPDKTFEFVEVEVADDTIETENFQFHGT